MGERAPATVLPGLLSSAAERAPASEAVRCGAASLTYAELDAGANRLARVLVGEGVRPGDRIGIYMDKSLESVVAIYAAMKAGAAYVPIDPLAPVSRVAFIVDDCEIRHLVSKNDRAARLRKVRERTAALGCVVGVEPRPDLALRCISWEEVGEAATHPPAAPGAAAADLAYILYTSGSTGQPKGVMHTHRSALAFVEWAVDEFGVGSEDRLSNHAPLHFDLSIFDLFAAAAAGAATVIVPGDVARLVASLGDLLEEERITIWYSVPFALIQLLQRGGLPSRDLAHLRTVLFAGEPFPLKHLRPLMRLLPEVAFYNLYGPTETNVCTFHPVPHPSADVAPAVTAIPIGRACAGAELRIVDADDRLVTAGELLVSSPTTMLGYWRRPKRTQRAFWRADADGGAERAFYRTGDSVRLGSGGELHFLGRQDRQIKLRGFRIELDEIEIALLAHEQVEEAAAYLVSQDDETRSIEAAVVSAPGASMTQQSLARHLSQLLPRYAIPERILVSESFPRTSTGKIDRQQLQARAATAHAEGGVYE